ncbi:hypothetical protein BMR19_24540, partial [Escherichia coli]
MVDATDGARGKRAAACVFGRAVGRMRRFPFAAARVAKISLSFGQQPLCGASVSRAPGGDGRICRGLLLL